MYVHLSCIGGNEDYYLSSWHKEEMVLVSKHAYICSNGLLQIHRKVCHRYPCTRNELKK